MDQSELDKRADAAEQRLEDAIPKATEEEALKEGATALEQMAKRTEMGQQNASATINLAVKQRAEHLRACAAKLTELLG
jgi:hypothetical protein